MKVKVDNWNVRGYCKLAKTLIATKRSKRKTLRYVKCHRCIHYGSEYCVYGKEVEVENGRVI